MEKTGLVIGGPTSVSTTRKRSNFQDEIAHSWQLKGYYYELCCIINYDKSSRPKMS